MLATLLTRLRYHGHVDLSTSLEHRQVADSAEAAGDYRAVILFLAYTGVRYGEMAALRVGRLDLMRRRASIVEAVADVNGAAVFGSPKNHSRRQVPIPRSLVDELATIVAGNGSDDFVFSTPQSGVLHLRNLGRNVWGPAVRAAGLDGLTPHALRHTAASLAIAAGANVKVVQQMLGHKSATMTLDLYRHLLPDQLDAVAELMDAAREDASRGRVSAAVIELRRPSLGANTASERIERHITRGLLQARLVQGVAVAAGTSCGISAD